MKTLKKYNSKIPSDISNVRSVVDEVLYYFKHLCDTLGDSNEFDLKVILNEIIYNAIKHGNKYDITKFVKVVARFVDNKYAYIVIEDEGEGYNHECLSKPSYNIYETIDQCNMKDTGRGLIIVKSLCDKVKFNKKGNKIIVLKKLCDD